MALGFELYSAGVMAPGVNSLAELLTLFRSGQQGVSAPLALPMPSALPANERRRTSQVARLVLACAEQAVLTSPYPADQLRCVFASDEGSGEVCHQMLEALTDTGHMSPLLFHNSVHNAPSGYFSIAYQNRQPSVSVSMGGESFAGGLLCAVTDACTSGQPVIFVAYDPPLPEPIRSLLPIEEATATAWIIASGAASEGRFTADPAVHAGAAWLLRAESSSSRCERRAKGAKLAAFGLGCEQQRAVVCRAGAACRWPGELRIRARGAALVREPCARCHRMLTRTEIEARVPHAGSMCLLDRVVRWDEARIVCEAAAPTADHPFALEAGVPAVTAIEYAAQAAALHGALLEGEGEPRAGMLATLSAVELMVGELDQGAGVLTVEADLLARGAAGCMYSFMVHDGHEHRARGRLLVAFGHGQ